MEIEGSRTSPFTRLANVGSMGSDGVDACLLRAWDPGLDLEDGVALEQSESSSADISFWEPLSVAIGRFFLTLPPAERRMARRSSTMVFHCGHMLLMARI